VKVFRTKRH